MTNCTLFPVPEFVLWFSKQRKFNTYCLLYQYFHQYLCRSSILAQFLQFQANKNYLIVLDFTRQCHWHQRPGETRHTYCQWRAPGRHPPPALRCYPATHPVEALKDTSNSSWFRPPASSHQYPALLGD